MSIKKLVRSVIFFAVCLAAIFVFNFFLPRLMPGDPLGHLVGANDTTSISAEQYEEYYHMLGLDKSLGEQFAAYVKDLFHGKLGYSIHYGRDVADVIGEKIPRTLQIAMPAWILSALIAFFLGTLSGYKKRSISDKLVTGAMVATDTVPTFLAAMLILIVFSYELGWFPFGALNSAVAPSDPALLFFDRLHHLILPILTMVLVSTPKKYLMMRNVAAKAAEEKYVVYAKARGLSTGRVLYGHIFPNVGQPFISMLGTSFGKILSGSIVIEMIFSIDGMGMLVSRAITDMDFPILQAALTVIAFAVVTSNLIADTICAFIDPKLREGDSA